MITYAPSSNLDHTFRPFLQCLPSPQSSRNRSIQHEMLPGTQSAQHSSKVQPPLPSDYINYDRLVEVLRILNKNSPKEPRVVVSAIRLPSSGSRN
jgi:hypothetical protein